MPAVFFFLSLFSFFFVFLLGRKGRGGVHSHWSGRVFCITSKSAISKKKMEKRGLFIQLNKSFFFFCVSMFWSLLPKYAYIHVSKCMYVCMYVCVAKGSGARSRGRHLQNRGCQSVCLSYLSSVSQISTVIGCMYTYISCFRFDPHAIS